MPTNIPSDVPLLCGKLLRWLEQLQSAPNQPVPLADVPKRLRAAIDACERRGLVVLLVWWTGSAIAASDGEGNTRILAYTQAEWHPAHALTHRPAPTHIALASVGRIWLDEERLKKLSPPSFWKHLKINNDIAELDGQTYSLSGQRDADFLQLLQKAKGQPVKANILQGRLGEQPNRIYDRLPEPLQKIIDKPGRGQKTGYRML